MAHVALPPSSCPSPYGVSDGSFHRGSVASVRRVLSCRWEGVPLDVPLTVSVTAVKGSDDSGCSCCSSKPFVSNTVVVDSPLGQWLQQVRHPCVAVGVSAGNVL